MSCYFYELRRFRLFVGVTCRYLLPVVVFSTVVTNVLVCVVLLKPNMRTATNTILVAMAISNILTGVWPLPCYLYFYIGGHYRDWMPHRWCNIYYLLTDNLPTIFHTASIWLTVALGIQRYVCVCHSTHAKEWCTVVNAVRIAVTINVAAFLSQVSRFFHYDYVQVSVRSLVDPEVLVYACVQKVNALVRGHADIHFNVYYWFRVVFIHLVPCFLLVIVNALLVQTIRVAQRRRFQLLKQNRKSECRRLAESNGTTMMLVTVVGVFLLVEFPLAILFIIVIVENTILDENVRLMEPNSTEIASMCINLFIMLSYSVNFFIYCGTSTQFRNTFKELFARKHNSFEQRPGRRGEQSVLCTEVEQILNVNQNSAL